ncbi:transcriptional regulator with XRE-family HTH domain [Pseudochelatococcus lubricantis]|uniref:Transcriptional regulator with XRE-family HTH domain n=1 Tax=Pseudochelatococcus lubricantis TaxID=1538102 RepID=A0ABX0V032_9HYPH|nr:helix-turn-helix domain-containing protein [Pseudochelatococcus lubricantis]NIJ57190.1 transcriptional regulator with XRE-family HTH domain [Pseudochelatococcus lubricantis]
MANNLKSLRKKHGLTQPELAGRMGTTKNQLIKLEKGDRRLDQQWIERAAEALGEPPEAIIGEGPIEAPVVGYVGAGTGAHFYDTTQGPLDVVEAPEGSSPLTVAVEIRGDSLGPFFDGWYVFYDDVRSEVTPDLIGEICVVGLPDGKILVKKIQAASTRGRYHLLGQFGEPILDSEVAWAAKVINFGRGRRR